MPADEAIDHISPDSVPDTIEVPLQIKRPPTEQVGRALRKLLSHNLINYRIGFWFVHVGWWWL
ncbi:hypothetical protein ACFXO9_08705 [Nocardia tengchongensis]|uniref:hypothetical protein n=1 Tax=Nocardia tengchongensis TaxID=2055889 RepID=UPI0036C36CBF